MGIGVVCVEVGNYEGRGDRYVKTLKAMVKRNLTVPHNFYCITDQEKDGINCIPAHPDLHGWWHKISMFKNGLFSEERLIFFDLDTFILKNIDDLSDYQGDFAMLKDFWGPYPASGVMLWKNGSDIWQKFIDQGFPMTHPLGDGGWLGDNCRCDLLQELYPRGYFVSYKTECIKEPPKTANVVCFHGKPRPHEARGWARNVWNSMKPDG